MVCVFYEVVSASVSEVLCGDVILCGGVMVCRVTVWAVWCGDVNLECGFVLRRCG